MSKAKTVVVHRTLPVVKRTAQGRYATPKNKHVRKNVKRYRGQGRP